MRILLSTIAPAQSFVPKLVQEPAVMTAIHALLGSPTLQRAAHACTALTEHQVKSVAHGLAELGSGKLVSTCHPNGVVHCGQ